MSVLFESIIFSIEISVGLIIKIRYTFPAHEQQIRRSPRDTIGGVSRGTAWHWVLEI